MLASYHWSLETDRESFHCVWNISSVRSPSSRFVSFHSLSFFSLNEFYRQTFGDHSHHQQSDRQVSKRAQEEFLRSYQPQQMQYEIVSSSSICCESYVLISDALGPPAPPRSLPVTPVMNIRSRALWKVNRRRRTQLPLVSHTSQI